MVNRLTICICIELPFFFYRIYRYAAPLQAQCSILVVVPFSIYYIVSLPAKFVLIVIISYFTILEIEIQAVSNMLKSVKSVKEV